MHETTRRRFVAGALTTGAAAALPGVAEAKTKKKAKAKAKRHRTRTADVCVVGAGFAGLTAARELVNAGKSVVVLEARDVVGGRVQNHELGGGEVSERGGTFVGPTQDHVLALAQQLGVDKFDTYDSGQNVYVSGGNRSTFSDTGLAKETTYRYRVRCQNVTGDSPYSGAVDETTFPDAPTAPSAGA